MSEPLPADLLGAAEAEENPYGSDHWRALAWLAGRDGHSAALEEIPAYRDAYRRGREAREARDSRPPSGDPER